MPGQNRGITASRPDSSAGRRSIAPSSGDKAPPMVDVGRGARGSRALVVGPHAGRRTIGLVTSRDDDSTTDTIRQQIEGTAPTVNIGPPPTPTPTGAKPLPPAPSVNTALSQRIDLIERQDRKSVV